MPPSSQKQPLSRRRASKTPGNPTPLSAHADKDKLQAASTSFTPHLHGSEGLQVLAWILPLEREKSPPAQLHRKKTTRRRRKEERLGGFAVAGGGAIGEEGTRHFTAGNANKSTNNKRCTIAAARKINRKWSGTKEGFCGEGIGGVII